jgi:hypothetical protein
MSFKKGANGIESKGKTKGRNLGDSGPTCKTMNGPIKNTVGKKNANMKSMGRGLAKLAAQRGR